MTLTNNQKRSFLNNQYKLAGRLIDPILGTIVYNNKTTKVRRKELEILELLAQSQGQLVNRTEFIEKIWNDNSFIGETGLTDKLSKLRKVLGDNDKSSPLIRTIPRQGYQLNCEVSLLKSAIGFKLSENDKIVDRFGWLLIKPISYTDYTETWLAGSSKNSTSVFRFCTNEDHLQWLRHEIKVLRYLNQTLSEFDNVITIQKWQLDNPPYYLEMPSTKHGELHTWLINNGGLSQIPMTMRLKLLSQLAQALSSVHQVGMIHRNLTPAALFIDEEDDKLSIKLGEFGIGALEQIDQLKDINLTVTDIKLTTSGLQANEIYLSPELILGSEASAASDVYALGLIIYQMIVGDLNCVLNRNWENHISNSKLKDLIGQCVNKQASSRITTKDIANRLADLISDNSLQTDPEITIKPTPPSALSPQAGNFIGPFRLLEILGEGGMGVVYLAEQREPVERKVALKLIKAGMDSDQVLARFEAERQALALMSHTNVSAVFEASKDDAGQPYFVMEYVSGQVLTKHCDHLKLSIRARVKLFLQVCDGVLHAHQKGVIHRDLNPNNIMVKTQSNQEPIIKIIDFGVAKSLQTKLSTHTLHTRLGSFVGTPSYASPEQISGLKNSIDTRSDIYSLGVVLYELLVGVTPYSTEELSNISPLELVQILNKNQAPIPTQMLHSLNNKFKANIAEYRSSTIENLNKVLNNEPTWIILKCLESNPEDRYGSVLELKKDLKRWLNNKPIEAKKTSQMYRFSKFVRRNRIAVFIGMSFAIALISITSFAVFAYLRAEETVIKLEQKTLEATKIAEFQSNQLKSLEPMKLGEDLKTQLITLLESEKLDKDDIETILKPVNFTDLSLNFLNKNYFQPAINEIKDKYKEYPLIQSRLWQSIADIMNKFGLFKEAIIPQNLAVTTFESNLGGSHKETLMSLFRLSRINNNLGNHQIAEDLLLNSIDGLKKILSDDDLDLLLVKRFHSNILISQGRSKEAFKQLKNLVEVFKIKFGPEHQETLLANSNYARVLDDLGRYKEAEKIYKEVLELQTAIFGEKHIDTIITMNNYSIILSINGQLDEAGVYIKKVYEGFSELLGEFHNNTIAAKSNYAYNLMERGDPESAIPILKDVLNKTIKIYGENHRETLYSQSILAESYFRSKRFEESEQLLNTTITDMKKIVSGSDMLISSAYLTLSKLFEAKGNLQEAKIYKGKVVEIYSLFYGIKHPETLKIVNELNALK